MNLMKIALGIGLVASVAACGHPSPTPDFKGVDRGFGQKHLSQLQAGIWIDPNGCDHWIIDDGVEGYLSQRLDPYGKPVCSGTAEPNTATGGFKRGGHIFDPRTGTQPQG
ncbi:hypothetical protein [Pseudooceanicola nitratireducens]|jgi:hypothetical protein|uniref:Lipoprotein n=1 Tax=Pseudooceanicola nitratireducens TaxID=517719 RepID=A0A1I1P0V5_9RHOB|nr:hypothetical protein [Pseudooceanicola nitratireducens]MEC7299972.1 hypothetical protein [Pseudomonadota bacterium]MBY6156179.1 hypothetical protein [Pseudooceanicola nitratireducens]MBY6167028.1 hypothetical protein [Pseudooceanicola nitratireducens]MEC7794521.1 hypothetical protein [Pseudomonadota bacterium]MEC8667645.1 hypothetical protein [Pseudomonadota bacterium]